MVFRMIYPKNYYVFFCEIYERNLCVICMGCGRAGRIRTRDNSTLAYTTQLYGDYIINHSKGSLLNNQDSMESKEPGFFRGKNVVFEGFFLPLPDNA